MVLPYQKPVPSPRVPIGAPPVGAPGMGTQPPTTDPMALLATLRQLTNAQAPPQPIYPSNYEKPKKLSPQKAYELGRKRRDDYTVRNYLYDKIIKQLRLQLVGVFPEDEEDRRNGFQEEFISTALIDEHRLAASFLSGLSYTVEKKVIDPTKRHEAQQLEDALFWLRDEDRLRHADRGYGTLEYDEANVLLMYGMIVARDVMDLRTPEFPWNSVLLDPSTVYPEWGDTGLLRCWQITRTTVAKVLSAYDPPDRIAKKVRDQFGGDDLNETEFTDFWDTWHHIAFAGDIVLHDEDHEYGSVPITIQYGPQGDPMFTSTPAEIPVRTHNGVLVTSESRWQDDIAYKALPYIYYLSRTHEQYEAIMARLITGMKKDINPPLNLARSNNIAGEERVAIETGPGAVNETSLEDEELSGFPTVANTFATQALLQALMADKNAGSLPALMGGENVKSNVTGVAANNLIDQGYDRLVPWQSALERFHARRAKQRLSYWRNFGHLAAYQGTDRPVQRLTIPRRRPRQGDAPAFELTTELIDRVGPGVEIKLSRVNPAQWLPLANAANMMKELGMFDPRFFAPYFGITDIDRYLEEAREYQTMQQIYNHPKFVEVKLAVDTLVAEIQETGDPTKRELLLNQLEMWLQIISGPAAAPPQQQMGGGGNPGAPMGPGGAQNPNTSAGVSYPALGQPPGMQQGVTGRPAGVPGPIV